MKTTYKKSTSLPYTQEDFFKKIVGAIEKEYDVRNLLQMADSQIKGLKLSKEIGSLAQLGNEHVKSRKMTVEIIDYKKNAYVKLKTFADVERITTYTLRPGKNNSTSEFIYSEEAENGFFQVINFFATRLILKNVLDARFKQVVIGLEQV